jgi:hypothetical protein
MMKSLSWRMGLAVTVGVLAMLGQATPVSAADEDNAGPADKLQRLEQRLNELAQRQEQLMRRLGAQQEREMPMAAPGRENFPPPMSARGPARLGQPIPPQEALVPAGVPAPEGLRAAAAKHLQEIAGLVRLCFLVAIVFNILLAIWIYTDIRKRGEGSGIFIALALLAGIPAAIIYTLVRLGDKKA